MREFQKVFRIVLPTVKMILKPLFNKSGNVHRREPKPIFPDVQVIAISILPTFYFLIVRILSLKDSSNTNHFQSLFIDRLIIDGATTRIIFFVLRCSTRSLSAGFAVCNGSSVIVDCTKGKWGEAGIGVVVKCKFWERYGVVKLFSYVRLVPIIKIRSS